MRALGWSVEYGVFTVLCAAGAIASARGKATRIRGDPPAAKLRRGTLALWVALPVCYNYTTQDPHHTERE